MSALYRRKATVHQARQVVGSTDGKAGRDLAAWCGGSVSGTWSEPKVFVPTLEGELVARVGDWIVKGSRGECWPVKGEIFAETYEPAEAAPDGFFQPGRTYAREHHGQQVEFTVRAVEPWPGRPGQWIAFGFRSDPYTGAEPFDSDDPTIWTDTAGAGESRG